MVDLLAGKKADLMESLSVGGMAVPKAELWVAVSALCSVAWLE
jgi:hypothetical protein